MRLEYNSSSLYFNLSGFPIPVFGWASKSLIKLFIFFISFLSFLTKKLKCFSAYSVILTE